MSMDIPDLLKEKLSAKGWRLTAQREKIFLIFQNMPKGNHASAEKVRDSLLQRGEKIGLSTVYRNLKLMTRMGILRELELAQGHKKYELNTDSITHHHIVCIQCNQTIEFENSLILKQSLKQVEEAGLKLIDCQLILHTICPEAIKMGWPAPLPNNWLCSRCNISQQVRDVKTDKRAKLRIVFKDERVVLYVPDELNQSDSFRQKAKSIQGWRYCRNDFGWYFPLDKAVEALNVLLQGYETEPKLESAIALIKQRQAEFLSKSAWQN
jgi:Fur family transcriptional regulator, ferric uptake regulator